MRISEGILRKTAEFLLKMRKLMKKRRSAGNTNDEMNSFRWIIILYEHNFHKAMFRERIEYKTYRCWAVCVAAMCALPRTVANWLICM